MAICMLIVSEPIASCGSVMPRIMEMALVQLTSDVAYITLSYPLLPSFS
jgi:inorganic pyrophosphatase/exopolyphosphatase